MELEFQRNKERFVFLKWGSTAFRNMLVVPPGSGIVHQFDSLIHPIDVLNERDSPACLITLHSNQNTNCRRVEQPKIFFTSSNKPSSALAATLQTPSSATTTTIVCHSPGTSAKPASDTGPEVELSETFPLEVSATFSPSISAGATATAAIPTFDATTCLSFAAKHDLGVRAIALEVADAEAALICSSTEVSATKRRRGRIRRDGEARAPVTTCGESILIGITESEGSTPSPENFVRDFGEGSCSRREREVLVRGGKRVPKF